jgi:hypothetical protein
MPPTPPGRRAALSAAVAVGVPDLLSDSGTAALQGWIIFVVMCSVSPEANAMVNPDPEM